MTSHNSLRGSWIYSGLATILFLWMVVFPAFSQSHSTDSSPVQEAAITDESHHDVTKLTPAEEVKEILQHKVENTRYIHEYPFPKVYFPQDWKVEIAGFSLDLSPSRHLIFLWISFGLTIALVWQAAAQNKRRVVPRGIGNVVESIVVFVRDEIALRFLGKDAARFLPLLLTFFFFITITNLVGLIPFGATATANINVTGALALVTFFMMLISGMRANGVWNYMKGLVPHGMPIPLYAILIPIEVLGLFTKPFALCIRLFANMLSGALVIGAFYALIFGLDSIFVAPLSIGFILFMSLLKLFVCFLQAYIFTILSTFFIGMSIHQEH